MYRLKVNHSCRMIWIRKQNMYLFLQFSYCFKQVKMTNVQLDQLFPPNSFEFSFSFGTLILYAWVGEVFSRE